MTIRMVLIAFVSMLALDGIYLMLTKSFFHNQIRLIQGSSMVIRMVPALLVYISATLGLYYFILNPRRPIKDAFILGFVIYSIFELTNMAIFDKWWIQTVLLDSIWGAILFSLTTYITYKLSNK